MRVGSVDGLLLAGRLQVRASRTRTSRVSAGSPGRPSASMDEGVEEVPTVFCGGGELAAYRRRDRGATATVRRSRDAACGSVVMRACRGRSQIVVDAESACRSVPRTDSGRWLAADRGRAVSQGARLPWLRWAGGRRCGDRAAAGDAGCATAGGRWCRCCWLPPRAVTSDLVPVLGLDRAPEVKTLLHRKLERRVSTRRGAASALRRARRRDADDRHLRRFATCALARAAPCRRLHPPARPQTCRYDATGGRCICDHREPRQHAGSRSDTRAATVGRGR